MGRYLIGHPKAGLSLCTELWIAKHRSAQLAGKHGATIKILADFVERTRISLDLGGPILTHWSYTEYQIEDEMYGFWPHQAMGVVTALNHGIKRTTSCSDGDYVRINTELQELCIPLYVADRLLELIKMDWTEHVERERKDANALMNARQQCGDFLVGATEPNDDYS